MTTDARIIALLSDEELQQRVAEVRESNARRAREFAVVDGVDGSGQQMCPVCVAAKAIALCAEHWSAPSQWKPDESRAHAQNFLAWDEGDRARHTLATMEGALQLLAGGADEQHRRGPIALCERHAREQREALQLAARSRDQER